MTATDKPLNGYVEGHTDSDYLGIFVLSPGAMTIKNIPPDNNEIRYMKMIENDFLDDNILYL
jgi:hypothetical protein